MKAEKFEAASLADPAHSPAPDMRCERIAYMFMVPTILNALKRTPGSESVRFPHLKCRLVSAADLRREGAESRRNLGDAIYLAYRQTEILPVAMKVPRRGSPRSAWLPAAARPRCLRRVADSG